MCICVYRDEGHVSQQSETTLLIYLIESDVHEEILFIFNGFFFNGKEFQMQEFPGCVEWAEQVATQETYKTFAIMMVKVEPFPKGKICNSDVFF